MAIILGFGRDGLASRLTTAFVTSEADVGEPKGLAMFAGSRDGLKRATASNGGSIEYAKTSINLGR